MGGRRSFGELPGLPGSSLDGSLAVSRAQQEQMYDLERMKLARETELIRQRAMQQRQKMEKASVQLRSDIQDHMQAARDRAYAIDQANRHEREYLRRMRAEVASERASFDHESRRREAAYTKYEAEQKKRSAARQRERAPRASSATKRKVPPPLATAAQLARYAAHERAFALFEGSASAEAQPMDSLPWPPDDCPVSGVRRTDSDDARKQRLKKAMLRWHPDKFVAAHSARVVPAELPAVIERLNAVLQRVQQERLLYGVTATASQERLPR